MANLTNYERETVILFNEAEGTAIVNTANSALSRRLAELAESRPGEVIFKKKQSALRGIRGAEEVDQGESVSRVVGAGKTTSSRTRTWAFAKLSCLTRGIPAVSPS